MSGENVARADGVLRADVIAWRASSSRFFFPAVTVYATIEYMVAVVVVSRCVVVEGTVVNRVCMTSVVGVVLINETVVLVVIDVCTIVIVVVETGVVYPNRDEQNGWRL